MSTSPHKCRQASGRSIPSRRTLNPKRCIKILHYCPAVRAERMLLGTRTLGDDKLFERFGEFARLGWKGM